MRRHRGARCITLSQARGDAYHRGSSPTRMSGSDEEYDRASHCHATFRPAAQILMLRGLDSSA